MGALGFVSIVVVVGGLVAIATVWVPVGRHPQPLRFLEAHDLAPTDASLRLARRFLTRDRWFRLLGAWLAFVVITATTELTAGRVRFGVPQLAAVVVGSALGLAWAARPPRQVLGATRSASLSARRVGDHIPARARTFEIVVTVAAAGASGTIGLLAVARDAPGLAWRMAALFVATVAGFVVTRTLQRRVMEAPRPVVDGDLAATDDARRGATVQSLHHALIAGVCCAGLAAVGGATLLSHRVEVAFDGDLVYRGEPSDATWAAAPTPDGGLVLWSDRNDAPDEHHTIRPPAATVGAVTADRWRVTGATGGGVISGGVPSDGWIPPLLTILLIGAAIGEWSRMRRVPYLPLDRRARPRPVRPSAPTSTTPA